MIGCAGPVLASIALALSDYEKHNSWPSSKEFMMAKIAGSIGSLAITGCLVSGARSDRRKDIITLAGTVVGIVVTIIVLPKR
jgi:zinc transporter ZupT